MNKAFVITLLVVAVLLIIAYDIALLMNLLGLQ